MRYIIPLIVFLAMVGFFYVGLDLDPKQIPSELIGDAAPKFTLPRLKNATETLSEENLKGQISLLNVWATWCVSCRQEHQLLVELRQRGIKVYGLNYKDDRTEALRWLQHYGDPYVANGFDEDGRVGIDWGVYGTPETFVIDHNGIIRYKFIGPLTAEKLTNQLFPLLAQIEAEQK